MQQSRQANNDKELTVKMYDLVEVLDDRRNWWKVKNYNGQIGHVPNTILKAYETTSKDKNDALNTGTFQTYTGFPTSTTATNNKIGYF